MATTAAKDPALRAYEVEQAANLILDLYDRVATGKTQGASGHYFANGRGTLDAVTVPVELLEVLARATGRTVHPRE